MNLEKIKNTTFIFKTYLFESGLYYLARSLEIVLKKNNNKIIYFPKAKYRQDGTRFVKVYPNPTAAEYDGVNHISPIMAPIDTQLENIIKNNNAKYIISFETLMNTGQWVSRLKSKADVTIIDVPMAEWVVGRFVENKSYKIFDEVWALTKPCEKIFSGYKNIKRVRWDYASNCNFKKIKRDDDIVTFYHPASTHTSSGNSSKNTLEVLRAFSTFSREASVKLVVSGLLSLAEQAEARKCRNILIINKNIDRKDILDFYQESHCLLAPSLREGLGLAFFEAKAAECSIITADADPMRVHTKYLCKISEESSDNSLIPITRCDASSILEQLRIYYEDYKMAKKTKAQIEEENKELMDAFESEDDSSNSEPNEEAANVDTEVLAHLKSKMNSKSKGKSVPKVKSKRIVAIEMAVIGVGQAGSRIAETMHKRGYDVGVINTSAQDLEHIEVMPQQKLLLEGSLGGTGKDQDLGRELFADSAEDIVKFVRPILAGNNMVYLAASGGGGTGSSSIDTMIPLLYDEGVPVGVIYVLPKATEDAQSKRNSIETLSRLAALASRDVVSSLVVVDNAQIEQIYAGLGQSKFWEVSNNAIVDPLTTFNTLTATPSRHTSLDPSDFGKIISCGDCSIYGQLVVEDYMEETALAEAVIESLTDNMLAEGFNLEQTRVGGVIITGPASALEQLPAVNINYCFHLISEKTNGASIFQGVYEVDTKADEVTIYTWFAGLGLPMDRIENLKKESEAQAKIARDKEKGRASAMTLDLGENQTDNAVNEIHRKIRKKKSGFGRLQGGGRKSIIDKRRR
jgi:cell division GTPase FtsZ